jgi:hypothetical protein
MVGAVPDDLAGTFALTYPKVVAAAFGMKPE